MDLDRSQIDSCIPNANVALNSCCLPCCKQRGFLIPSNRTSAQWLPSFSMYDWWQSVNQVWMICKMYHEHWGFFPWWPVFSPNLPSVLLSRMKPFIFVSWSKPPLNVPTHNPRNNIFISPLKKCNETSVWHLSLFGASQVVLVVKNPPAHAGGAGSIPGWGRFPGEGNGDPLQYSCLENPMDRGAGLATVHGVAKSWTWLKRLSTHARTRQFGKSCSGLMLILLALCL